MLWASNAWEFAALILSVSQTIVATISFILVQVIYAHPAQIVNLTIPMALNCLSENPPHGRSHGC